MLHQSKVYKCLEKKTLVLGFEIADLFILCILLSLLNIFFSQSAMKLFLTWGPTFTLAMVMRIVKHGKAENFLLHWIRYHVQPGVLRAFAPAHGNQFFELKQRGRRNVRPGSIWQS